MCLLVMAISTKKNCAHPFKILETKVSEDVLLNIEKVHDLIVSVVIARDRWHGDGALHVIAGRHAGPLV